MRFAVALVALAGLSHVRVDSPVIDANVPANAPHLPAAASPAVAVGWNADAYLNDCEALVAQWRQLEQLEQELKRP